MRWPLISRKRHMREFTELSRAYQRDIVDAQNRAANAETKLRQWVGALAPRTHTHNDHLRDTMVITVEVARHLAERAPIHELNQMLAHEIVRRLHGLHNDYRGDLRESEGDRLLKRR